MRALLPVLCLLPVVASGTPRATVEIRVVSFSDWHGQLDPLVIGTQQVGGAAALATYFEQERAEHPDTLVLTAGDAVGGTPPLSSFFDDEPALLALDLMGLDVDTFGNHNFDHGLDHLQEHIDLAPWPYVCANLDGVEDSLEGVVPYQLFQLGEVTVAVIGIVNEDANDLTFPGSLGTMTIADPVSSANHARARAKAQGAEVFVAITHLGVTGFDTAGTAQGPLIDFANEVGNFDLIIGDHTDVRYSGYHNGALVVENLSKGASYAVSAIEVDPQNGRVERTSVEFVTPVASLVTPDPEVVAMLAPYRSALAAQMDRKIGTATATFPRGGNIERLGEVAIGNLVAEAIRDRYDTQLALINGGGLRAPLPSAYTVTSTTVNRTSAPFDLVVGDAYTVLPFGNEVVTQNVTGVQLYQMLENGVSAIPGANGRFPQIAGFSFVYDSAQPPGSRVVSVALSNGTPIPEDGTLYSIAIPDFLNEGGDGYTALVDGQGTTRELMADILADYIEAAATISPVLDGRIDDLAR